MIDSRIKVLVVEDSTTVRAVLVHAIESEPRMRVLGAVASGEEALTFLAEQKPDVILMDIHLPGINGFETTRRIMHTCPVPIVICSATADTSDVATTFEAMQAGAVAALPKPQGPLTAGYKPAMQHLLDTVKLMSEVKVVRRWNRRVQGTTTIAVGEKALSAPEGMAKIVAIGTSTGGPPVLRGILADLPANTRVPIVIVQHIAEGFLPGLVDWLGQSTTLPIHLASHGAYPLPGHVYFAPDRFHLGFNVQRQFALVPRATEDLLCPSVSHLFQSLADVYGASAVGVLLTGMGKDGARELALLKERGAITIAQDKSTSVVHGMPGEAIRLGGATHVLPGRDIAAALKQILRQ